MSSKLKFTFDGLNVTGVQEFEDGAWVAVVEEPGKSWTYDGSIVSLVEIEDGLPHVQRTYSDVDGDGIFLLDGASILDHPSSTVDSNDNKAEAYRFTFADDGSILTVREYEDGGFQLHDANDLAKETWTHNADGTLTRVEVGDDTQEVYADLDGDGVYTLISRGASQYASGDDSNDVDSDGSDDDYLSGSSNDDFMDGGRGDDDIETGSGDDSVLGGDGSDLINSGSGNDRLNGGSGDDYLVGGAGDDTINGGIGNDRVDYSEETGNVSVDLVTGMELDDRGTDRLSLVEHVRGGHGNDTLTGNGGGNDLDGGNGNDDVRGGGGKDTLCGSAGDDSLDGGDGDDLFDGGHDADDDSYIGGAGLDTVSYRGASGGVDVYLGATSNQGKSLKAGDVAGVGVDQISNVEHVSGSSFDDRLVGNAKGNRLDGGNGRDNLNGAAGDDSLLGGNGDDRLLGGAGDDSLRGGNGSDVVRGGAGHDDAWGGSGADDFLFDDSDFGGLDSLTADHIRDFSLVDHDQLDLRPVDANTTNAAGTDDAFTFIGTTDFNGTAGQLRYEIAGDHTNVLGDVNGDGSADFMIELDGALALTADNFLL